MHKHLLRIAAATAVVAPLLFGASVALAAVTNGSFENGVDAGSFTTLSAGDSTSVSNWSVDAGSVDYIGSYWSASNGVRSLDLNGLAAGTMSQTIPTTVGTTYKVTFDLSGNPDSRTAEDPLFSPSAKAVAVSATGAAPQTFTYDTSVQGNSLGDMKWQSNSYTFTATASNTTLSFVSQIPGAFGPALDNVSVTIVTPDCSSDDTTFDTFSLGNVNGQHGWGSTGSYDQAIVLNTYGYPTFGCKSLRISDAVTSGSFGDQTFSYSIPNEAGEAVAENGGMSGGTRQNHFEAQFDLASTMAVLQPGMHMSVSPDRGDGARMSYLRFEDQADGVHVFFDDVTNPSGVQNAETFNETDIATIDRGPHTIKFSMTFVAGPHNDIVKIYIDGVLKATGTSWEDYYRYDTESNPSAPSDTSRTVDSLLFRESGANNPADQGNGFLIDNMSISSSMVAGPKVVIAKYVDGVHATANNANDAVFPMWTSWTSSGPNGNNPGVGFTLSPQPWGGIGDPYEATYINGQLGDNYNTNEVTTGNDVVGASCTDGKPFALEGYTTGSSWAEAAQGTPSLTSPAFTNLQTDQYVIVWNKTCPQYVQVHIVKYVDGVHATAGNANSASFSMQATYTGTSQELGFINGTNPYDLNVAGNYEATTLHLAKGFHYGTFENMNSVVGSSCTVGKPFALVGYKVGDSLAAAQAATMTTSAPDFTNLQSDKYVIVLNTKCPVLGSISGMKYNDLNRNGKKDTNEPGLQGWTIKLENEATETVIATTVTDANGNYTFSNLVPGTYEVREKHQKGWKRMSKNPKDIVITSGSVVTGVNFGNATIRRGEREDNDNDDQRHDNPGRYNSNRGNNDYNRDQVNNSKNNQRDD